MNCAVRIGSFLRREFSPSKTGGRIIRIECRHFPINAKRGEEIWSVDLDPANQKTVESLADEIAAQCEEDAEGIASGPQRYALFIFRENAPDRAIRGVVFMVEATDAEAQGELETEPASRHGMTAMAMRHLEATQRMMLGSLAAIMGAQQKMVQTVTGENEKLRNERIEAITAIEEVFSQKHERELQAEQARARTQIMKDGAEKLTALAPLAIAHLTGRKSPEIAAATRVAALMQGMSEEQQMKLFALITSDDFKATETQKIALGDLVQSINDGSGPEH